MNKLEIQILAKSKKSAIVVSKSEDQSVLNLPLSFLASDYKLNESYEILISEKQFKEFLIGSYF